MNNCACLEYTGDNPNCPIEEHRDMYADFQGRAAMVKQLEQTRRDKKVAKRVIQETAKSLNCNFARVSRLTLTVDPRTPAEFAADEWQAEYTEDVRALALGL